MRQGKAVSETPVRGRPRSQESETAILDATMELLSELGYRSVTVEAIAIRAGASKSTIYRRWPTKENLVIAAFARTPELVSSGRGSVEEQLLEVILQFTRIMQQTPLGGVLAALVAERSHNPALDEALGPLVQRRRRVTVEILRAAVARGELPPGINAEVVVDLLMGPVLLRSMVMGQKVDRRFVRQVVQNVCAGLRAN